MSDVMVAHTPARQWRQTLAATRLHCLPPPSRPAIGLAVGGAALEGGAPDVAPDTLHQGPPGRCPGRSTGEMEYTSMCKSLQAWLAPEAGVCGTAHKACVAVITTLVFNPLPGARKVTDPLGLAHHLPWQFPCGRGYYSHGQLQCGAGSGASSQSSRRQPPYFRRGTPVWRVCQTGVPQGIPFPQSGCWKDSAPKQADEVRVGWTRSPGNCLPGANSQTR